MKKTMGKKLLFASVITGAALMQAGCFSSSSDGSPTGSPPRAELPVVKPGQPGSPQDPSGPAVPVIPTGSVESVDVHFVQNVGGLWQACAAINATVLRHNRDGRLVEALQVNDDGSVDVRALEKTDYLSIVNETESSVAVFSAEVALLGQGQDFSVSGYSGRAGECFGGDGSSSQPQPSFEVKVANPERFTEINVGPGGAKANIEDLDYSDPNAVDKALRTLQVLDEPYDILVAGYTRGNFGIGVRLDKYQLISGASQQADAPVLSNPVSDPVAIPFMMTTPVGAYESVKTELYSPQDDWQYALEINQVLPDGFGGFHTVDELRTIDDASRDLIVSRSIFTPDMRQAIETRERFANDVSSITMPDKDLQLLNNVVLSEGGINYSFGGDGAEVVVAKGLRFYEPGEGAPLGAKKVQQAVFRSSATGYLVMPDLEDSWAPAEPFQNHTVEIVTSDSAIHIYDHLALIVMEFADNIITSSVLDDDVIRDMESIPLGLRLTEPYTKYRVKSKPL